MGVKGYSYLIAVVLVFLGSSTAFADRPNVLLIMVDDMNTDLGTFGHPLVKTPNIDALAGQGVQFNAAYAQYPACTPSRASMLTGLYPDQIGVVDNNVDFRKIVPDVVTLPQYFRQQGYTASRVGKIFHMGVPGEIGADGMDDPYAWDKVINPKGIDKDVEDRVNTIYPGSASKKPGLGGTLSWLSIESEDSEHTDGKVAQAAADLLNEFNPQKTGKPFFIGVGFFRPHTPFIAPERYFEKYPLDQIKPIANPEDDRDDIPKAAWADRPFQLDMSEETKKQVIQAYYASISFVDNQVGSVLSSLKEQGLDKNTIVVFASDHGYQLGHHELWQKGDVFEGSARTPLIVHAPDQSGNGKSTDSLVELIDLYPTLVELAGLKMPDFLAGESLTPILGDPSQKVRSSALTMTRSRAGGIHPEMRNLDITGYSIRTENYRYTSWGDGIAGEELYNYVDDPGEFNNQARTYSYMTVRSKLNLLLKERVEEAKQRHESVKLDLEEIGFPGSGLH